MGLPVRPITKYDLYEQVQAIHRSAEDGESLIGLIPVEELLRGEEDEDEIVENEGDGSEGGEDERDDSKGEEVSDSEAVVRD